MKFRRNVLLVFFSIVVLIPLLFPLLKPGTLHEFDMLLHIERIVAFYRSLQEHIIPPTWSTYLSYGFGSPVLIYNWSFPYYVASVALLFGVTPVDAYKWMTALSYVLSFFCMYVFLESVAKSKIAAFVGAAWYVWAPYHFNINQLRGAIGEEFAMGFWPGIFWATHLIFSGKKIIGFLWCSFFMALTVWSHSALFGMIMPLWVLFSVMEYVHTKNIHALLYIFVSLLVGMGLVAYSWFPMIFERASIGWMNQENIFLDNFVRWQQLLAQPGFYEFGLQLGPTRYLVFYSIGWPLILIGLFTAVFLVISFVRRNWSVTKTYQALFLGMGGLSLILLRPISVFLWMYVPFLASVISFPQRFLGLTTFCGSVLAALFIQSFQSRYTLVTALFCIAVVTLINIPYITLNKNREPDLKKMNEPVLTATDVWGEFSPKGIPMDFRNHGTGHALEPLIRVEPDLVQKPLCQQTSTVVQCTVNTKNSSSIRFRQFVFPGWYAYADKILIPINSAPDGTILLKIPSLTHIVKIEYRGTTLANFGKFISLLFLTGYLFLFGKTLYTYRRKIYQ